MGQFFVMIAKALSSLWTKLVATIAKALSSKLAIVAKPLAGLSSKLALNFMVLAGASVAVLERFLGGLLETFGQGVVGILLVKFFTNDPRLIRAGHQLSRELGRALVADYEIVIAALFGCLVLPLTFAGLPLAYKAVTRRRQLVFVSFSHVREAVAREVQAALDRAGARVYRIPFEDGATHQSVVTRAALGVKTCDGVVCIPGPAASYVEHEIFAATATDKPIVFLVSEDAGTMPNTADKRYPVFKLETTKNAQFEPLIRFIEYVGADLKSTWALCGAALAHPFMLTSVGVTLAFFAVTVGWLLGWCYFKVSSVGAMIAKAVPDSLAVLSPVVMAHVVLLGTVLAALAIVGCFSLLFVVNLSRQLHARSKARLKTTAARFDRADWLGVIPGLSRDRLLYECLFESAPYAHHEAQSQLS